MKHLYTTGGYPTGALYLGDTGLNGPSKTARLCGIFLCLLAEYSPNKLNTEVLRKVTFTHFTH